MTQVADPQTAEALRHCQMVTRRCARNFYYGLKLSPEPHRSALYAMYAWMRHADDLADAPGSVEEKRRRVLAFREETNAALRGDGDQDDPLWVAMKDTVDRFELDTTLLETMLEGQLQDLTTTEYRTFDELREYCYRVASTVGLICIDVWGYEDPAARPLAVDRGIAFQLTNILRDFKQDFDAGWIYLPQQDFASCCISPEDLRRWSDPPRCERFMREQIDRAERYYKDSARLDYMVAAPCRSSLWAMTSIYRDLLDKMKNHPSQVIHRRRVRLSTLRKGTIALRARFLAGSGRSA